LGSLSGQRWWKAKKSEKISDLTNAHPLISVRKALNEKTRRMIAAFRDIDMKMPSSPEVNKAGCLEAAIGDSRVAWLQWRQDLTQAFLSVEED
jgi:hypothetical protein